jgi:hypothetical protein
MKINSSKGLLAVGLTTILLLQSGKISFEKNGIGNHEVAILSYQQSLDLNPTKKDWLKRKIR